MFEPFPGNYVWNLGVNLAMIGGGNLGEIDAACRPVRDGALSADAGSARFFESWIAVADQMVANARDDEAAGRNWSAAQKLFRASGYYLGAERLQSRDYAPRWAAYRSGLDSFRRYIELDAAAVDFIDIPYEGSSFPALFVKAPATADGPAPCIVSCNGQGANHDWGEMQKRRRLREGENPVPHYWDHVMWVFGKPDIDAFMAWAPTMCLDGVVEMIKVPFLITHGQGDRQIPLEYAHRSYDRATSSPDRCLRIFTPEDFEIEHCGADNGTVGRDFIADWIARQFDRPIAG